MNRFAVILVAAGKSSRFRDDNYKKPFAPLANKPVWLHSAERFLARDDVKQLIVVLAAEDIDTFREKFGANLAILGIDIAAGGETRAESVRAGLELIRQDIPFVAIHDAVRPVLADTWISNVFNAAVEHDAAILAAPINSTIKRSRDGKWIDETLPRDNLWEAQTPQAFRLALLNEALAATSDATATDEAQVVEQFGKPVRIVRCSHLNLKITLREDLRFVEQALKALPRSNPGFTNPFDERFQ